MAPHPLGDAVNDFEAGDGPPEPESRFLLAAGLLVHGAMVVAALSWLWLRERLDVLPERSIGEQGPLLGSFCGLGVGVAGAFSMAQASSRLRSLREVEAVAQRVFAGAGDMALVAFVTFGAVAEELFFRLAVQDLLGLAGSVATCIVVNSTVAGWAWLPIAAMHALLLGLLVQQGFGLLGSTTANAVMNYFHLRRILCSASMCR